MRGTPIPPPHAGGGNMDCRHLTAGTTLYLPVDVEGGLLSLGDAHAAQGDGEVAISGLECAMRTRIRVDVVGDARLPAPQLRRPPGSLTPRVRPRRLVRDHGCRAGSHGGVAGGRAAMIEHLGRERAPSGEGSSRRVIGQGRDSLAVVGTDGAHR